MHATLNSFRGSSSFWGFVLRPKTNPADWLTAWQSWNNLDFTLKWWIFSVILELFGKQCFPYYKKGRLQKGNMNEEKWTFSKHTCLTSHTNYRLLKHKTQYFLFLNIEGYTPINHFQKVAQLPYSSEYKNRSLRFPWVLVTARYTLC